MSILIGCERNGKIRDSFIKLGHNAISCDLVETTVPGPHYKGDIRDMLTGDWDLMIAHPDCTYLCSSGLHWNHRTPGREEKTSEAVEFVRLLMNADIPRIVIENPIGRIGTAIRKADQYIQPYEYGHDASKRTALWLKGLPALVSSPANYIEPRIVEYPKGSGKLVKRWGNQTDSGQNKLPPSAERSMLRAETYQGWADAMAAQWGCEL